MLRRPRISLLTCNSLYISVYFYDIAIMYIFPTCLKGIFHLPPLPGAQLVLRCDCFTWRTFWLRVGRVVQEAGPGVFCGYFTCIFEAKCSRGRCLTRPGKHFRTNTAWLPVWLFWCSPCNTKMMDGWNVLLRFFGSSFPLCHVFAALCFAFLCPRPLPPPLLLSPHPGLRGFICLVVGFFVGLIHVSPPTLTL